VLLKYNSIKDDPVETLNVRRISSGKERTLGELKVKLIVGNYETEHKLHVVGDGVNISYNGLVGRDFFRKSKLTLIICRRKLLWDRFD
jgi:hypothetical protein